MGRGPLAPLLPAAGRVQYISKEIVNFCGNEYIFSEKMPAGAPQPGAGSRLASTLPQVADARNKK